MERCSYRPARHSDLPVLRSELGEGAWRHLSGLLEFSCTQLGWILLGIEGGALAGVLVLAAPSEFNLPVEVIRLHRGLDGRVSGLRLFQLAIGKAKTLGSRLLYCTSPVDSADASVISEARFRPWRKVVRFESEGPIHPEVPRYRSTEVGNFARAVIIALIEKTSEDCRDSQIEFYRRRLGGIADAEMTLQMMETTRYDPRWWRVALAPDGNALGIILPVIAFAEPTVGFIGVVPEWRGRKIASFLLMEAWSVMKQQGYSRLCAEADERNVSMHCALIKSQFRRQWQKQEWRLEL
jgi:GNAT superfamily N-acetyltransferase